MMRIDGRGCKIVKEALTHKKKTKSTRVCIKYLGLRYSTQYNVLELSTLNRTLVSKQINQCILKSQALFQSRTIRQYQLGSSVSINLIGAINTPFDLPLNRLAHSILDCPNRSIRASCLVRRFSIDWGFLGVNLLIWCSVSLCYMMFGVN